MKGGMNKADKSCQFWQRGEAKKFPNPRVELKMERIKVRMFRICMHPIKGLTKITLTEIKPEGLNLFRNEPYFFCAHSPIRI